MTASSPIIGHQQQRSQLLRECEEGKVTHAYLFVGPRHIGKFTIARWFAGELLCRHGAPRESAAHLLERNIHPDVLVLDQLWVEGVCTDWGIIARSSNAPQAHRARPPRAKTDTIHIDDIRAVHDRLCETSTVGIRVFLLRSLERLHTTAASALLHILEEPPPNTIIVCTTQAPGALLPTIRSRMRHILFSSLPTQELTPLLADLPTVERSFLLNYAQGAPGVLCRLRGDKDELRRQRQLAAQAQQLWDQGSAYAHLTLLLSLCEAELETYLTHLLLAIRERLRSAGPRPLPHSHFTLSSLRTTLRLLHSLRNNVQRELLLQHFSLALTPPSPHP